MKFNYLHLRGFRQHLHSDIVFGSGITAILGANGTGKSTIFEGGGFALFGKQRAEQDTIHFLWGGTDKYSSTLGFEIDNTAYEVMRSNSTAYLKNLATGAMLATSKDAVTAEVEKILGLNFDEFKNSYWAQQKEIAFLNFKSNAETQKKVNKMLGYDRVGTAEDLAKDRSKDGKMRIDALASVMGDIAALMADVSAKESEIKSISSELNGRSAAQKRNSDRRESVEANAERARRHGELSSEIAILASRSGALIEARMTSNTELEAAQKDSERRSAIESDVAKFGPADVELKAIRAAKSQVEERRLLESQFATKTALLTTQKAGIALIVVGDVTELCKTLSVEKSRAANAKASLESASSEWVADKNRATSALAVAQSELRGLTASREAAEKKITAGICPGCNAPIGESAMEILQELITAEADKSIEVDAARLAAMIPEPADIGTHRQALAAAEQSVKEIDGQIEDARAAELRKVQAESTAERTAQEITGINRQLAGLPVGYDEAKERELSAVHETLQPLFLEFGRLAGAEDRFTRAKAAQTVALSNLADAKTKSDKTRTDRSALGFDTEEDKAGLVAAADAIRSLESDRMEASTLAAEIGGLTRRKEAAEFALDAAKRRVEEYRAREDDLKALRATKSLYDTLASEMKSLRVQLNASIVPDLSARASEILTMLTNGRYTELVLDGNFNASLIDDGVAKSVISGGEEDAKDISLRLGLCGMIQERKGRPMSLIMLDEIWGSLDVERRQSVNDLLVGLKGMYEQIILISHIEGTSEIADNTIHLYRDPETRATVVGDGPQEFELQGEAA